MSKSIRISPKHGVNPMIPRCFFCGGEKNEIALLGKLAGDAEAPKTGWLRSDYEPCDKCKAYWAMGYALLEADDKPIVDGQAPMQKGVYPTGQYVVLTEQGIRGLFPEDMADFIVKAGKAFLDREAYRKVCAIVEEAKKEETK